MTMLLIPGYMLDADVWRDVEPDVQQWAPVVHADTSQDADVAAMARRALAETKGLLIVVGFSMGGYVARAIVRQAPERVVALILIATSARGDNEVQTKRKASLAAQTGPVAFKGLSTSAIVSSLHPDNAS